MASNLSTNRHLSSHDVAAAHSCAVYDNVSLQPCRSFKASKIIRFKRIKLRYFRLFFYFESLSCQSRSIGLVFSSGLLLLKRTHFNESQVVCP